MSKKPQSQDERSKYLSYLLRHKPEAAKLTLNKQGWCSLEQLTSNTDFGFAEICQIVAADSKGRYSFDDENPHRATAIRANQGHSTNHVRITFDKAVPPTVLYHGTTDAAFETIVKEGLKPMSRHHVHLTDDLDTAKDVGGRRKRDLVVLRIDAKQMLADGVEFFRSDNGVWLVSAVDAKYISQEL